MVEANPNIPPGWKLMMGKEKDHIVKQEIMENQEMKEFPTIEIDAIVQEEIPPS